MNPFMRATLLCLALAAAAGCSTQSGATPVYDPNTRELTRIDYDYNADGIVDVRTFMRAGKPLRLEGDANGDGTVDRWEHYDQSGQLERVGASSQQDGTEDTWIYRFGDETRMELSTARDGRIDRREFYRGDVLVRAESDSDGDGRYDSWEQFDHGRLASIGVDDSGTTGRPTRRILYAADGSVRVEVDPDGDGRFEAEAAQ
jgi:hypothetical protein